MTLTRVQAGEALRWTVARVPTACHLFEGIALGLGNTESLPTPVLLNAASFSSLVIFLKLSEKR